MGQVSEYVRTKDGSFAVCLQALEGLRVARSSLSHVVLNLNLAIGDSGQLTRRDATCDWTRGDLYFSRHFIVGTGSSPDTRILYPDSTINSSEVQGENLEAQVFLRFLASS